MKKICIGLALLTALGACSKPDFHVCAPRDNDLVAMLEREGYRLKKHRFPHRAAERTHSGQGLILIAGDYPARPETLSPELLSLIRGKGIRAYIEYFVPHRTDTLPSPRQLELERVVVADNNLFSQLPPMHLLTINGSFIVPGLSAGTPLLVTAKVAGMDTAEFGLDNTPSDPLLSLDGNILWASSALSNFARARFMPESSWKTVWEGIVSHLSGKPAVIGSYPVLVRPSYGRDGALPPGAVENAVERGMQWFFKGHFLVDGSWRGEWLEKYQGDGTNPVGPPLPADAKNGDGTLGMLEGHCSYIDYDGSQRYRYWMRNDVQGESSMAFSIAGDYLGDENYKRLAANLADYSFAAFRVGPAADPSRPSYGLLGWSTTHPDIYYQDDNARSILGMIATASVLGTDRWDAMILEAIAANFRTTGVNGFRGPLVMGRQLEELGWRHFRDRELIKPHPHLESWIWAVYLYLYNRTGDADLLDRTKKGIRLTMEAYPGGWEWTNGIQQERARMILPLAWLLRVEPTEEHRRWLDTMVGDLLEHQQDCGAIREELGDPSKGWYGGAASNAEYGLREAPLIFRNGDPVADMLYTSNFAFFALNEAAKAANNPRYYRAVEKLADFLVRIQVESEAFPDVDGAWFRAFNYAGWNYWASNSDAGWGAWCTLTGWIQSWIVATLAMVDTNDCLWDIINTHSIENGWPEVRDEMLVDFFPLNEYRRPLSNKYFS